MPYRIERDSMGELTVPAEHLWGAQTQRSLQNFPIGTEKMPPELLGAMALVKKAAALANAELGALGREKAELIAQVCDELLDGLHAAEFPLSLWQTGSGTHTNMNFNEVIAHRGNELAGRTLLHPNDDVNRSQSSNDTLPTALHLAAARAMTALDAPLADFCAALDELIARYGSLVKSGRTHLQDAVPLSFGQELGGWRAAIEDDRTLLARSLDGLYALALGGTAVGTGLNAPEGFDRAAVTRLAALTGLPFRPAENKFQALSSKNALCFAHGALKTLAADLFKIANDVRLLASGPRCGLGELELPANEPGSSIMPGKVNPSQCEALAMVCVQVMGNDVAISLAAAQGQFQLNTYLPLLAHNFLQSARLLRDATASFTRRCLRGLRPKAEKMQENLRRSLMTATALNLHIGYDRAAAAVKMAFEENLSLREACAALGYLSAEEFDEIYRPEAMI